ncbi:MAG: peptidase M50 [Magnetovibrio sp.]|nr:peptidase M50 [Magnetovibrio sp.]
MTKLPKLREELALHPGTTSFDGSPTWIIHDPVTNRFFSIGNSAFEILARWIKGHAEHIVRSVNRETTISITIKDVEELSIFLFKNELTVPAGEAGVLRFLQSMKNRKKSWLLWLFHNYLFFKIPLFKPDYFLSGTIKFFRWAFSRWFLYITLFVLFAGVFTVIRQWEYFVSTFLDTFSWNGLLQFTLSLIIIKIVHEFAHAYTAKQFGCRIPSMGVAFMVLWPMPYTDMTDVWKLQNQKQRIAVAAAGVGSELIIASWATFAWCVLPPGALNQVAFFLATTTWISSVTINMFPFLRFDGYYILADWIGIENLHSRSFAIGRWWLREKLFDLRERPPEHLPQNRARFLVFFAFLVWVYRLIFFTAIALVVYHFFIKAIGIILFLAEIAWFIALPIASEFQQWFYRRNTIAKRKRSLFTASIIIFLIFLGLVPWKGQITVPAVLGAEKQISLVAPTAGRLIDFPSTGGQLVKKNDIVVSLENPDLDHQLFLANTKIIRTEYELEASQLGSSWKKQTQTLLVALEKLFAEVALIRERKEQLIIKSPIDGIIVDIDPTLNHGQWIKTGQMLATLRSREKARIVAYVDETQVHNIETGRECIFFLETGNHESIPCKISIVERVARRKLEDISLASIYGGSIPVHINNSDLVMDKAHYRVIIKLGANTFSLRTQLRGIVRISTPKQVPLAHLFKFILAVIIRESGM